MGRGSFDHGHTPPFHVQRRLIRKSAEREYKTECLAPRAMDWGAKSAAALGLGHVDELCWDAEGGLALLITVVKIHDVYLYKFGPIKIFHGLTLKLY